MSVFVFGLAFFKKVLYAFPMGKRMKCLARSFMDFDLEGGLSQATAATLEELRRAFKEVCDETSEDESSAI